MVKPGPTSPASFGVAAEAEAAATSAAIAASTARMNAERLGLMPGVRAQTLRGFLSSSLLDGEGALHERRVRVAHELVGALLQRHRPRDGGLPADRGLLVQTGTGDVEVVTRRRVADDDLVLAGLQALHRLPALRHADLELVVDESLQRRRR